MGGDNYSDNRNNTFFNNTVELGEFLRKYMVDDVFISTDEVEYYANARDPESYREKYYDNYYERKENGKLIRLPVNCKVSFISIRFRSEVDKTQFILLKTGEYPFLEQLDIDLKIKRATSRHDESRDIICPICREHYDLPENIETIQAI